MFLTQGVNNPLTESSDTKFLGKIYTMEVTLCACISEVQSLLDSRPKIAFVRSFQGIDAQMFINFLDQVS